MANKYFIPECLTAPQEWLQYSDAASIISTP